MSGDLLYLGQNGAYSMNTINNANQSLLGLTNYGGVVNGSQLGQHYGGYDLGALRQQSMLNPYQAIQSQQVPMPASSVLEYMERLAKPAKSAKSAKRAILAKLKEEIDGWHGDVLDRLATA